MFPFPDEFCTLEINSKQSKSRQIEDDITYPKIGLTFRVHFAMACNFEKSIRKPKSHIVQSLKFHRYILRYTYIKYLRIQKPLNIYTNTVFLFTLTADIEKTEKDVKRNGNVARWIERAVLSPPSSWIQRERGHLSEVDIPAKCKRKRICWHRKVTEQ